MGYLTRDDILKAEDVRTETVLVPEWGGEVLVKALSGAERDMFESSLTVQTGGKAQLNVTNMRAKLAAMAMVNEEGRNLFSQSDVQELGQKCAAALDRVFTVAQRLAGLSKDDVEALSANFPDAQSESSISDSL